MAKELEPIGETSFEIERSTDSPFSQSDRHLVNTANEVNAISGNLNGLFLDDDAEFKVSERYRISMHHPRGLEGVKDDEKAALNGDEKSSRYLEMLRKIPKTEANVVDLSSRRPKGAQTIVYDASKKYVP